MGHHRQRAPVNSKKLTKHLYTMGKKLSFKGEPHETYIAPPLCNMSFLKCHFFITYLPSEQVYLKCQLWNYCLSCHRLFLPSNNMLKKASGSNSKITVKHKKV